jgi:hypothetical protein
MILQESITNKKAVSAGIIGEYSTIRDKESFIKTATIQIMSTPEYQLLRLPNPLARGLNKCKMFGMKPEKKINKSAIISSSGGGGRGPL